MTVDGRWSAALHIRRSPYVCLGVGGLVRCGRRTEGQRVGAGGGGRGGGVSGGLTDGEPQAHGPAVVPTVVHMSVPNEDGHLLLWAH